MSDLMDNVGMVVDEWGRCALVLDRGAAGLYFGMANKRWVFETGHRGWDSRWWSFVVMFLYAGCVALCACCLARSAAVLRMLYDFKFEGAAIHGGLYSHWVDIRIPESKRHLLNCSSTTFNKISMVKVYAASDMTTIISISTSSGELMRCIHWYSLVH